MNGCNAHFLIVKNVFQEENASQKMIFEMIHGERSYFFYVLPFVSKISTALVSEK